MSMTLTEADMAQAFAQRMAMREDTKLLPYFAGIEPEVDCLQGRPDFIGITSEEAFASALWGSALTEALATPSLAHIMALLKRRAPRREEYLLRVTGLSVPVFRRAMAALEHRDIVERMGSGYVLAPHVPNLQTRLWAFELKLDHWQRALFQACQYQAFAHATLVVISAHSAHRAERHHARFEALGVGLVAFDAVTAELRVLVQPARRRPLSQRHYLFALGRVLARQPRD